MPRCKAMQCHDTRRYNATTQCDAALRPATGGLAVCGASAPYSAVVIFAFRLSPRRPMSGGVFGINLAVPILLSCHNQRSVRRRPDGCGLGRGLLGRRLRRPQEPELTRTRGPEPLASGSVAAQPRRPGRRPDAEGPFVAGPQARRSLVPSTSDTREAVGRPSRDGAPEAEGAPTVRPRRGGRPEQARGAAREEGAGLGGGRGGGGSLPPVCRGELAPRSPRLGSTISDAEWRMAVRPIRDEQGTMREQQRARSDGPAEDRAADRLDSRVGPRAPAPREPPTLTGLFPQFPAREVV